MYRLISALGVVVAACLALGCGSSGEDATTARETVATTLTKAQFIKRAEAICESVRADRIAALNSFGKKSSARAGAGDAAKTITAPSLNREAEELKGLEAPAQDKANLASLVSALSKMSKAFENGSSGAKTAISVLPQYQQDSVALGLGKCRQP